MKKFVAFFIIVVIPYVVLQLLFRPTSGPGPASERALTNCRWAIETWKAATTNNPNFNFFNLSQDIKQVSVASLGRTSDLLIKTNFVWGNTSNGEIVIVCHKEYSDLHKPGFWNSFLPNPAHAAAFSDGTARLISPAEFAGLNLTGFISVRELGTNSAFNIFKK